MKTLALIGHFQVNFFLDLFLAMSSKIGEDEGIGCHSSCNSLVGSSLLFLFEDSVVDGFKNIFF